MTFQPCFSFLPVPPSRLYTSQPSRCCSSKLAVQATLRANKQRPLPSPSPSLQPDRQSASPAPEAAPDADGDDAPFNWSDQWYAIAYEQDIPDGTPIAFTLFDTEIVLFRESPGQYSALLDRCPHRLAPLSSGRIVMNDAGCPEIECRYHGWRFGGSGSCTAIPQIQAGASIPRGSSVRAFPVASWQGLLFVWFGDASRADRTRLPIPDFVESEERPLYNRTFSGLLPVAFETLVENIIDPAHFGFSHHGTSSIAHRERPTGDNKAFSMSVDALGGGVLDCSYGTDRIQFHPPGLVAFDTSAVGQARLTMLFHMSPAGPRMSRLVLTNVFRGARGTDRLSLAATTRLAQHIDVLNILDGDTDILRGVERRLGAPSRWRAEYGPASGETDRFLLPFRAWMDDQRDHMPWAHPIPPIPAEETLPLERINDRLEYHTKHCNTCTGALQNFERGVKLAQTVRSLAVVGSVSAFLVAAMSEREITSSADLSVVVGFMAACAIVILLSTATQRICQRYIERLTFTDFSRKAFLNVK